MDPIKALNAGDVIGRYAIERELGRGGTAIVYLARDRETDVQVALKVLRPELAESMGADRFLREIRLTSALRHPHIIPVIDSGKDGSRLYVALPYMDGGTLRARLQREKQLPLSDAIEICRTLADALEYAHGQKVIHRDVKPENILFSGGKVYLTDFGIARALERALEETTTTTGVVRGTPAYMSPEQAAGEKNLDGRSDTYSLGCVLYEMLAGMPAFTGPTSQSVIAQRLTHGPRSLRVYRPSVPKTLERVIEKALKPAVADRYQSSHEMMRELDRAVAEGDRMSRRQRLRTAALVTGAAVVVAVGVANLPSETPAAASTPDGIPEGDQRRIAVLYFTNQSPATLPAHVVDGITEDLIDDLSAVRTLHVISPNGVRPFRDGTASVDSIRRALKVGTIMSGTVARSGDVLRVNVRLVDAATSQQLGVEPLEQRWTELFALQDALAAKVAYALRQQLGNAIALRNVRGQTRSFDAWEAVRLASAESRQGVAANISGDNRASQFFLRADSLYARAAMLDPEWIHPVLKRGRMALALGGAVGTPIPPRSADSAAYRNMNVLERRELWIHRSIAFADDVLRRSPGTAEALALRGEARYALVLLRRPGTDTLLPLIARDVQAAVDARPDNAQAWVTLAQVAQAEGRFADAAAAAERAFEADAYYEVRRVLSTAFSMSLYSEQWANAARWCRMGLDRYAADPRFTECELNLLGWSGRSRADVAAAWRALEHIEQRDTLRLLTETWAYRRMMVAATLTRAGMADSARRLLATLVAARTADSTKRAPRTVEAYVRLLLNDRDSALVLIAEHLRLVPLARSQLGLHPWFRTLRGDPRFEDLLKPAA